MLRASRTARAAEVVWNLSRRAPMSALGSTPEDRCVLFILPVLRQTPPVARWLVKGSTPPEMRAATQIGPLPATEAANVSVVTASLCHVHKNILGSILILDLEL